MRLMNYITSSTPASDFFEIITDQLATQGWARTPGFLPDTTIAQLANDAIQEKLSGGLHPAGVSQSRIINTNIRGDHIRWLTPPDVTPAQTVYFEQMEALRQSLNRNLQLGLFELESHVAIYPSGAGYQRHLDNFQRSNQRILTCILYLNPDWQASDGGQLRMYLGDDAEDRVDVLPEAGTLLTFLSERYWHEVLPATRDRISMTGWFKARGGQ